MLILMAFVRLIVRDVSVMAPYNRINSVQGNTAIVWLKATITVAA